MRMTRSGRKCTARALWALSLALLFVAGICIPAHAADLQAFQHILYLPVIASDDHSPVSKGSQPFRSRGNGVLILIDSDQPSAGSQAPAHFKGMSSAAQRAVYIDAIRTDTQAVYRFFQQYRFVFKRHMPRPSIFSAISSISS